MSSSEDDQLEQRSLCIDVLELEQLYNGSIEAYGDCSASAFFVETVVNDDSSRDSVQPNLYHTRSYTSKNNAPSGATKKTHTLNLSIEEKILFVKLTNQFPDVASVRSNIRNSLNVERKRNAWKQITKEFNRLSSFRYRDTQVLQDFQKTLKETRNHDKGDYKKTRIHMMIDGQNILGDNPKTKIKTLRREKNINAQILEYQMQYYQLRCENQKNLLNLQKQHLELKRERICWERKVLLKRESLLNKNSTEESTILTYLKSKQSLIK